MKKAFYLFLTSTLALGLSAQQSYGQGNDFFGSSLPNSVPSASNPPPTGGKGDFSDDEKRMQKKYKNNLQYYKALVARGDDMMKRGEAKHDDRMYKRGKIYKEIGEKNLTEMQANNPFPQEPPKDKDKEKDKKPAKP